MDTDDARFWLDVIAVGAAVVWAVGAWFVLRTARTQADPLGGELEVAASPAAVLAHAARQIAAASGASPLQSSTIDGVTAREVRWHSTGALRHSGTLTATGDSKRARVAWQIVARAGVLRAAQIVVVAGAVVTAGLYWALREHVATSANGAVRGQVLQMAQAIHVLWPPFLLAGVAWRLRRRITDEVSRFVQNAPFA